MKNTKEKIFNLWDAGKSMEEIANLTQTEWREIKNIVYGARPEKDGMQIAKRKASKIISKWF